MIIFFLLFLFSISCTNVEKQKNPNLLIIIIDTLRADHVGSYGYYRDTTPNIDALAVNGTLFENAYSQISATVPSHAAIMTSVYPWKLGVFNNQMTLKDDATTLAEILQGKGYATGAVIGNGTLVSEHGLAQGCAFYDDAMPVKEPNREHYQKTPEQTSKSAIQWLKKQKHGQPFFLWINYMDPHGPYTPAPPYNSRFKPVDRGRKIEKSASNLERYRIPLYQVLDGQNDVDYYISQYDGEIRMTDEWIGTLIQGLKDLGFFENTIVVVLSDHGESLGEHGWYFCHGNLASQEQIRIPLIMRYPKSIPKNNRIAQPVESIDIMPTLLDLLGLPKPETVDGKTLLPMMIKEKAQMVTIYSTSALLDGKKITTAVMRGEWKMIRSEDGKEELFNLMQDPNEDVNLLGKYPEIEDKLRLLLDGQFAGIHFVQENREMDPEKAKRLKSLGYIN